MDIDWQAFIQFFVTTFSLLIMVVSLMAMIIPVYPGVVVIWIMSFLSVLLASSKTGWIIFGVLTLLMVIGSVSDNLFMGAKVREKGASWLSIGLGLFAGLVGTIIFPPIGGVIAAPLVLYGMEYHRLKDREKALIIVKGLLIGWGWAYVARLVIGIIMIVVWGVWVFNSS